MNTKKCPKCGKEIPAIAKKCEFCGEWQDEKSVKKAMSNRDTKSSVVDLSKYNLSKIDHTYCKPNLSLKSVNKGENLKENPSKPNTAQASIDHNIIPSDNNLDNSEKLPHADIDVIKQKTAENMEVAKNNNLDFFLKQKRTLIIGITAGIIFIVACVICYNLIMDSRILLRSDSETCTTEDIENFEETEEFAEVSIEESEAEVAIIQGVYKITSKVLARTAPGDNAKAATKYGIYADVSAEKLYLTTDDFVEATGNVKDGYAEVKDHLTGDTSCSSWDDEKVWVPIGNLQKVEKCNHEHLMADGLI